jgi:recombination associated protein RdgC
MWFKNLTIYRLPQAWKVSADALEHFLQRDIFSECSAGDLQSQGWASPRENDQLVHRVSGQFLMMLATEKKLLPASVINQVTRARCIDIEEQQGYAPGRKQKKEIKEQVTEDLLPRAFAIRRNTWVWIDPKHGWLVIDAANAAKAEEVIKSLLKCVDGIQLASLHTQRSPVSAMTEWLAADIAPHGFTIDQDTELQSTTQGKATVRFVRHALEADDVARHIAGGKQCTRLAMTWNDRVSFVLTESLTIKRVTPLDVLKESDVSTSDEHERFDNDATLMSGELRQLIEGLVVALGGEPEADKAGKPGK